MLLTKAFKGELAAQLDTDDDAIALLEKIERLKVEVSGKKATNSKKK